MAAHKQVTDAATSRQSDCFNRKNVSKKTKIGLYKAPVGPVVFYARGARASAGPDESELADIRYLNDFTKNIWS